VHPLDKNQNLIVSRCTVQLWGGDINYVHEQMKKLSRETASLLLCSSVFHISTQYCLVKAPLKVGRPSFASNINLKLHIMLLFDNRILLAVGKYCLLYSAKRARLCIGICGRN
jgi:hypothetical protein